ncbi:MAG: choice-of-anchor G family protein [Sporichthyaceae bacterium]
MPAPRSTRTSARHKRPTPNRGRQGLALTVTGVMSAGVVLGAAPAFAADEPISQARGFFLSGFALGDNLDDLVELDDARARNTGNKDTVRELNPLKATLLNSLDIPLGPVNLLQGNGALSLGAVNQAAIARKSGSAIGASGAVTDSGAIAVDGKSGTPAANATLDLSKLLASDLGGGLVDGLIDVDLEVGAIAASADQRSGDDGKQSGDYRIAQLKLKLQSPLLADLLGGLDLAGMQGEVDGLNGVLDGLDLNDLLGGLLGGLTGADLEADNLPVLADIVDDQDLTLGSGAVTVDLSNGKITVDVEALLKSLGLDLNNLPPNTELVRLILDALTERVVDLVKDAVKDLVDDITAAVDDIEITGTATGLLGVEALDLSSITGTLDDLLDDLLDTVLDPVSDLLADVAGPLLDPLFDALEDVLSIRVNVQSSSGGTFTQRALQVRVLPQSDVLTVNLASASVGPGNGVEGAPPEDDEDDDNPLPKTGAGTDDLAAAGLALVLAGAAAAAGARNGSASGTPARRRSKGRHART